MNDPNQWQVECTQALFTVLATTSTVFREVLSFSFSDSPKIPLITTTLSKPHIL